jgi:hypothetical protein
VSPFELCDDNEINYWENEPFELCDDNEINYWENEGQLNFRRSLPDILRKQWN